jgi:hypothetical protein
MKNSFYLMKNVGQNLFDDSNFAFGEQSHEVFRTGEAKKCEGCGNYISMLEWLEPLEINVSSNKLGDFIFGTFVGFIVSDKFKRLYNESSLKSIKKFTQVRIKNANFDENYFYPEIPILKAFIDLSLVEFESESLCRVCQKGGSEIKKVEGVVFLNPTDIKDDIFFTTALGQADVFVSTAFKNFIQEHNFKNCKFIDASEYHFVS